MEVISVDGESSPSGREALFYLLGSTTYPHRKFVGHYLGLNWVSQKDLLEVLTPGAYKYDCIWKHGLCRCNQVK